MLREWPATLQNFTRARCRIGVLPAVLAFFLEVRPLEAQERRTLAEATVVSPGRCLDRERLVARAGEWLGGSSLDPHVSVVVEESASGVHLVVRRDADVVGERTLELPSTSCEDVQEATALALASALDGKVIPEPTAPSPEPPRYAPSARLRPVEATGTSAPAARPVRLPIAAGPQVTLAVDVGMLASVLPQAAMVFEPALDVSLTSWLDVRAAVLASSSITIPLEDEGDRSHGDADVALVAGRADGCLARAWQRGPRIRGCGGIVAGAVEAEGGAVENPRSESTSWLAVSARADARFDAAEGFGIGVGVEGYVPLVRPELVVATPAAPRASFPPVGAAVMAGPSYRF